MGRSEGEGEEWWEEVREASRREDTRQGRAEKRPGRKKTGKEGGCQREGKE